MCGFVGCFGKIDKRVDEAGKLINHRGPDEQKYLEGNDWSLKFNRLSIIDLSTEAMQPFSFDSVDVFVNGEIYNYIELREKYQKEFHFKTLSDIEIIPFLYKKFGIKFLNYLNGMFSMVIIDNKKNKKYLIRDRYGKKPLYYTQKDEILYFSSEIKSFDNLIDLELDKENFAINFIANLNPEPLTPYKNISSVLPGHYYEYQNNSLTKKRWYIPNIIENSQKFSKIQDNFNHLVNSSVDLRLRSDVPVGVFLSGGLDSNLILNLAIKKNKNISAYICNIPNKEKISDISTDVTIPKKICEEYSCKYKEIVFDLDYLKKNLINILFDYDLLFSGTGHLIFHALSKEAKKNNTKVILTGSGGDEITGGYYWQRKTHKIPSSLFYSKKNNFFSYLDKLVKYIFFKKNKFLIRIYKFYQTIFKPSLYHVESHNLNLSFFMKDTYLMVEKKIEDLYDNYLNISNSVFSDKKSSNNFEYRNIFMTIASQNHFFDISTMSSSIENRAPLLDYRLVEYMFSISKDKKNKRGIKSLYKKMLENFLPRFVVESKKSGPSLPIGIWLDDDKKLKEEIILYINKNISYIENYLSLDLAKNLMNKKIELIDKHFLIRFRIFCMIIWYKIKFEKSITNPNLSIEKILKN